MILDAIIGLIVSIFSALFQGVTMVFVPVINLIAVAVEVIVGIFVSGFSLGRLERKKKTGEGQNRQSAASPIVGTVVLLLVMAAAVWFLMWPRLSQREIALIAEDGHSLPFAALVVHTKGGDLQRRTDNAGNIVLPRFSVRAITIKDPRYVEQTWTKGELDSALIVRRTVLGSGLDSLADRLLEPTKE